MKAGCLAAILLAGLGVCFVLSLLTGCDAWEREDRCVSERCGVLCTRASTMNPNDPVRRDRCVACIAACVEEARHDRE